MNQQAQKSPMIKLSDTTLDDLPDAIGRPVYDRAALTPGIVHIGVGNFHRAHQAWYLHRLMQMGQAMDWAIVGAGVRSYDEGQREKLAAQDYLTTLIELDPQGIATEVTGAMIDYVPVTEDNIPLINRMAQPDIRIVSLTVTEGGYYTLPATNAFHADHPDIQHDAQNPERPRTVFGAIVAALKIRRNSGAGPFTGLCCDNIQGNGAVLHQTVTGLARLSDPDLADWIDVHCSFPISMVDCIVPATGPSEIELVQSFGIDDAVPVTHEKFRQWVIEDNFCAGRPDWDRVGAIFSDQVHAYETMKIRILNGGHQVIAGAGELLSHQTIADCMADDLIAALFAKVALEEIAPHVRSVPNTSSNAYVDLIASRFANPRIVDTTRRVAFDGSSRHPGFIIPSIRDGLASGCPIEGLALVEAIWARMCAGQREDGSTIGPNDPNWDALQQAAFAAKTEPSAWLAQTQFYGELDAQPRFAEAFIRWLRLVWSKGTADAIAAYLND